MNGRAIFWGIALAVGAATVATGVMPGSAGLQSGPRIGIAMVLGTMAFLALSLSLAEPFLRMTTKPKDYQGTCPVGASCAACGAFNLYGRRDCRSCKAPIAAELRSEAL